MSFSNRYRTAMGEYYASMNDSLVALVKEAEKRRTGVHTKQIRESKNAEEKESNEAEANRRKRTVGKIGNIFL